jgi:hypothetical protein
MAARIHRPPKIVAFNVSSIWLQRSELSKQLQDLHTDVALLSETHLKTQEWFFIPNYHFIVLTVSMEEKAEVPLQ